MKIIKRTGFPIPKKMDAITIGTWIFIKEPDNKALLEHEKIHIKQFKAQPFTFWLRYLFSKEARFQYEAEAYAVSVTNGLTLSVAVSLLTNGYSLNITAKQAETEIAKWMGD